MSIVAGVKTKILQEGLGVDSIIRVMPNTPAQIKKGMTVWTSSKSVPTDILSFSEKILSVLGEELYVDDEALIDALNRRKIYAVGLDVYKNEPNLNPGYLKSKTAFILPHLGSATKDTRIAMANLAIDNINEFFETGSSKNKVN